MTIGATGALILGGAKIVLSSSSCGVTPVHLQILDKMYIVIISTQTNKKKTHYNVVNSYDTISTLLYHKNH